MSAFLGGNHHPDPAGLQGGRVHSCFQMARVCLRGVGWGPLLTMGGMAAALCFSCLRSRGFWGELSRASFRRLGLLDSNLRGERERPFCEWCRWEESLFAGRGLRLRNRRRSAISQAGRETFGANARRPLQKPTPLGRQRLRDRGTGSTVEGAETERTTHSKRSVL